MSSKYLEQHNIAAIAVPVDTTGAAIVGDSIALTDYNRAAFVISFGAWASGTPTLTFDQSTDFSAGGTKTLGFTKTYSKVGLTGTVWVENTVTSDTIDLAATPNLITVIDFAAEELDVTGGFTNIDLDLGSPGAATDLISITAHLYEPRYPQTAVKMANPIA